MPLRDGVVISRTSVMNMDIFPPFSPVARRQNAEFQTFPDF